MSRKATAQSKQAEQSVQKKEQQQQELIIKRVTKTLKNIGLEEPEKIVEEHKIFGQEQLEDFYLQVYALLCLDVEVTPDTITRILEVISVTVYFEFDPAVFADAEDEKCIALAK